MFSPKKASKLPFLGQVQNLRKISFLGTLDQEDMEKNSEISTM